MSLNRKVAVVTGASSGIGKAAARQLAAAGWDVFIHGRDPERLVQAREEIASAAGTGTRIESHQADLCSLSAAAQLAAEIASKTDHIDVLLANAGGVRDRRLVTDEGNEATFAGNHLGHFLLTSRLLPLLKVAAAGRPAGATRIINVSSRGHMAAQAIDWNDLQGLKNWTSIGSYGVAKLSNILYAKELARRLAEYGIIAHALHPGVVASNFAAHGTPELQAHMAAADSISPEAAAADLVWLATAPEPGQSTGRYWAERAEVQPSPLALDEEAARRLWRESENLIAGAGF